MKEKRVACICKEIEVETQYIVRIREAAWDGMGFYSPAGPWKLLGVYGNDKTKADWAKDKFQKENNNWCYDIEVTTNTQEEIKKLKPFTI